LNRTIADVIQRHGTVQCMGTWNGRFLNKQGVMFGVGMLLRQLSWQTAEKIICSGSWHSHVKYT